MKLIEIDGPKNASIISVDFKSIVGAFKKIPPVIRYTVMLVVSLAVPYLLIFKMYFHYSEIKRIEKIEAQIVSVEETIDVASSVLFKYNMLLSYLNNNIQIIKATQKQQINRFEYIIKYLEKTGVKTERDKMFLEQLKHELYHVDEYVNKLEQLYNQSQKLSSDEIKPMLNEIERQLEKLPYNELRLEKINR